MNLSTNTESEPSIEISTDPSPIVESAVVPPVIMDEDREFGFKRDEMYSESFPKPADPYDRHVFLAFQSPSTWPSHVEKLPLPSKFSQALKKYKDELKRKTKFAVIEGGTDTGIEDGDVLIFPEMIKFKNLSEDGVDEFVKKVLVNESSLESAEKLNGFHVFVCTHASRDKRCGVCGPILVKKLKEEIENGFKDAVFVSPCSHIGGHKYAGNVIIFGPNADGKVMGHWYGYVTPEDVPVLLEQHIGKGEVVERLWRGEVCQPQEEKKQELDLKPQQSNGVPYPNGTDLENNSEEFHESVSEGKMENGGSCCQGANGFTCCKDDKVVFDENVTENKPRGGSTKCANGVEKISAWMGRLEQPDILVGVAVIGAVASIAVAYSIYRRSG